MSSNPIGTLLLVSGDLMLRSQLEAGARSTGLTLRVASSWEAALAIAATERCRLVCVDLGNQTALPPKWPDALKTPCGPQPRIVAFGPHVQTGLLEAAREAGCDVVLPRGAFLKQFPDILRLATPQES